MLYISETFINRTQGYRFNDTEPYESDAETIGELFRDLQDEYGRCVSKVYVDTKQGTKQLGWVFEKRMTYDDCRGSRRPEDTYIREVWVTVHDGPPTVTPHYHDF